MTAKHLIRIFAGVAMGLAGLWLACWLGHLILSIEYGQQWYEFPALFTCVAVAVMGVGAGVVLNTDLNAD